MSFYPHTRALGSQAGIQLNPLQDNTDGFVTDTTDQVVACVMRAKRGRIDKPFLVNRGNFTQKLGAPESLRVSALNEAMVHVYEAVNNGAQSAVIARLTSAAAINSFMVFSIDTVSGLSSFSASAAVPTSAYVFYLQDLECFNDGVLFQVNASQVLDPTTQTPVNSNVITINIMAPDGTLRYSVTGSLDKGATDEYGADFYIGSLMEAQTPTILITAAASATISTAADCYGKADDGSTAFAANTTPLVLFAEGGTAYTTEDYDRVIAGLEASTFDYGYGISGGSQAVALISKLATMNNRANRQLIVDVPGDLTPEAAEAWVRQLDIGSRYVHFYWAPLRTDDPLNGGKATIGLGGYQAGLRCSRNAQTNSYGLAPKNYPIAGKNWLVARTSVEQLVVPNDFELSDLADAKINPVMFQSYNSGSGYVFLDSLTSFPTVASYQKLISVAEMTSSIDDMVAKAGKEFLQLPMDVAITKMGVFLKSLFDGARASGWLVASANPALGTNGYTYTIVRNLQRPADRMDVNYGLHYDGVARAIFLTQTLSN